MKLAIKKITLLIITIFFASCDAVKSIGEKAKSISRYEKVSLYLSKENRELKGTINRLKYQIEELKSKKKFLELQLEKKRSRSIASIAPVSPKK